MKFLIILLAAAGILAVPAHAQPKKLERDVEKQRAAVEAWTACIADEFPDDVANFLETDYRSDGYSRMASDLTQRRVSERCFNAMPRAYRRIELGGLPFAGGLAERMIERGDVPLLKRLSMAAIGREAQTFSYTDQIASCMTRGAPHLVAKLFGTPINSPDEAAALAELEPVKQVCTSQGKPLEASPLAMRSMLATAAFRLLEAQKVTDDA